MGTLSFFEIHFKTYFLQGFFTINSIWACLFSGDFLSKIQMFFFFFWYGIYTVFICSIWTALCFVYIYVCICVRECVYSNCRYFLILKMCVFMCVCVCFSWCILIIPCLILEETWPMRFLFLFLFFQMGFSTIYHSWLSSKYIFFPLKSDDIICSFLID